MYGTENIFQALNVPAVTNNLDDYKTYKALFASNVAPADFTGDTYITFYMSAPYNTADDIEIYNYSINCRAKTFEQSRTIAKSVIDNVNRVSYGDFFITCSLLITIQPADDSDVYNTPIEAILKKR